ncbi:MAG TPA: hypothetical protein VFM09_12800 [Marmoricola sp.]|nr:hypothetical protein [Marmoricola sp.]
MTQQPAAPRRPRHLMDPDNPRPAARNEGMSLTQVQRWVMSTLALTTILHFAAGLVVAAVFLERSRTDGRIALNLLAAAVAVMGIAAARLIHQKNPLSPWLLLGLLVAPVGLWCTFTFS